MRSRLGTVALSTLLAAASLVWQQAAARATFPGGNGLIAFASNRDGDDDIFTVAADGSGLVNVSSNGTFDYNPVWSADGRKIVFESGRDGNNEIYVMKPDGTGVTRLTFDPAYDASPMWSPDGGKIAFIRYGGGSSDLFVMNADGTGVTNLTSDAAVDGDPSWSPDGTKIAFDSTLPGSADVYTIKPDGTGRVDLTSDPATDETPSWSPDGTKIAFASDRAGDLEVYTMNADGSSPSRLTFDPGVDLSPSWSPDGTKLVFDSSRDGTVEIFAMNADGSGLTKLTDTAFDSCCANWQPVGMDLDVDTNRDGAVEDSIDETGEGVWTAATGAIYAVNLDDDDGNALPDAISTTEEGVPENEDGKVDTGGDVGDLAPLVVRAPPKSVVLAQDTTLWLRATQPAEVKAFHLFPKIAAGQTAIWGGVGETTPGIPAPAEVDITQYLNDPPGSQTTATTFGIEGLFFRHTDPAVYGGTFPKGFDGDLDFVLEKHLPGGVVEEVDRVALKVAPLILLPNTQAALSVWAAKDGNHDFLAGLAGLGPLLHTYDSGQHDDQWAQDHVEFGYTQFPGNDVAPGASVTLVVVRLPRDIRNDRGNTPPGGPQPAWPVSDNDGDGTKDLLGPGKGVFRFRDTIENDGSLDHTCPLPKQSGPDSGEYGGNIEVAPPTAAFPLGRIVVGSTMVPKSPLRHFLADQEVQGPPVVVDTCWLTVGHVDEELSFVPAAGGFKVVMADPKLAEQLLKSGNPASGVSAPPETAVFFGEDTDHDGTVTLVSGQASDKPKSAACTGPSTAMVDGAGTIFTGGNERILRIYAGKGAGQVALVADDETTPGIDGLRDGCVKIASVWRIPRVASSGPLQGPAAPDDCIAACNVGTAPATQTKWFQKPDSSSKYVLVEASRAWFVKDAETGAVKGNVPALTTVSEILYRNDALWTQNHKIAAELAATKTELESKLGLTDSDFVSVPVIYMGELDGAKLVPRSAVAWTPGLANLQVAGGSLWFPKQFGPKDLAGADVFQKDVAAQLAGAQFVDDWYSYHRFDGDVHCGTAVQRGGYAFGWWTAVPA